MYGLLCDWAKDTENQKGKRIITGKVGISTTHMSHIETANTKMSLPTFVSLAAVLEVRTDELLYDSRPEDRSVSIDYITELLDNCTIQQIRIIEDIVKAVKESLNKNI